jgi:hypothetical protein
MKSALLKALILLGRVITKAGVSLGILGAVISITCMQVLEQNEQRRSK